ncbi:winged helix-turn-helix domain-containing protein [Enterobacteriaceae bacterium H18W14]|uniref:winged helix-turn-helix domain-containing protein n=1 Tax=Dryocola boscaweniae TaxID=2925397 RepID=UPI0022F13EE6|nr:winged helix-turn-helix domain-containing protein [Dryocola boscaweniae]MCT4715257.1 winged helix-turn-helix domain-containing protein [Dryocola boscaweniae]
MRYVLQDMLIFDVKEGCLSSVDSGQKVKLPYPAVLILDVFCQNAQVLISRNNLMDKAWIENDFHGSGSNLYNSLSAIRKAISTLGIEQQAIRTQPKVGYILELTVTPVEPEPGALSIGDEVTKQDWFVGQGINDHPPPEPAVLKSEDGGKNDKPVKVSALFNLLKFPWLRCFTLPNHYVLWTLVVITLILTTQVVLSSISNDNGILPSNYDLMATEQKCSLFRLDPLTDIYPAIPAAKKIEMLAGKYNINCRVNQVKFYIHSMGAVQQINHVFKILIVMCVYNRSNGLVTKCFNDYMAPQHNESKA